MKTKESIKNFALLLLSALFVFLVFGVALASPYGQSKAKTPTSAANQSSAAPQTSQSSPSSQSPDIEIKARVTAKELKFEVVGNATVEFTGNMKRDTVSNFDRGNLPNPVKPGVIYRDIEVRLLITTMFSDIKSIVSEVLREGAANQEETRQKNEPSQTKTPPPITKKPGGGTR